MSAGGAHGLLLGLLIVAAAGMGTNALSQQVQEPQPVERYNKPFPDRWLRWIFDEAIVERSRQDDRTHKQATKPGDLTLSAVLWPAPEITAGAPLLACVSITNPAEHRAFLPFIGSVAEAIHFEITDAQGRRVGRAYQPPPPRPDGPIEVFPASSAKSYETIVSYWYDFAQPGEHTVEAELIVVDHAHRQEEPVVLSSQVTTVKVLPRDPERLTQRCDQLFMAQRLGGAPPTPVAPAPGTDFVPSAEACRRALLHITDEVVLPHLRLMVRDHPDYPDPVTAMSYVDSPKAIALLTSLAETGRGRTQHQARVELERLGVEPAAPPMTVLPPGMPARELIEGLCKREGLALVADLDAAESETAVHADPAASVAELAEAFEAVGLRAYDSAGGRALVVLGPPSPADAEALDDRLATGWRLLETVTPQQLALTQRAGPHAGYISSQDLTREQIELACDLLMPPRYGPPPAYGRERAPVEKLFLAVWTLSGYDVIIDTDWGAVLRRWRGGDKGPPLPPDMMPPPLGGSVLWWYWPYALADDVAEDEVTVGPVRASLDELVKLEPLSGFVEVSEEGDWGLGRELLVSARKAPVRDLVWALEVASGLQAKLGPPGEVPRWSFVGDRWPGEPERPDMLVRLPSLGCRSPYHTPAGRARLGSRTAAPPISRPPAPAYYLADLPVILRSRILECLPPPASLDLAPETDYEDLAAQGRIVVLWAQGIHLEPALQEPDGSGILTEINLPAF